MKKTLLFLAFVLFVISLKSQELSAEINITDENCNLGKIVINATGGIGSYVYAVEVKNNIPTSTSFTSQNIIEVTAGEYDVYVRDNNGATGFTEIKKLVEVTHIPNLALAVTNFNPDCSGDTGGIAATATGGSGSYEYQLEKTGTIIQSYSVNSSFSNLMPGDYIVKVRDSNGCLVVESVTIEVVSTLIGTVTINKDVTCTEPRGAIISVNASGGVGGYEYSIDGGTTWQNISIFTDILEGVYNVLARDSNGCESVLDILTLTSPDTIEYMVEPTLCYDGTNGEIKVTVNQGNGFYKFSLNGGPWMTPVPSNSNIYTFSDVLPGNYSVRVSDSYGCESISTNYTIYSSLTATTNVVNASCGLSNITVIATGGTGKYGYELMDTQGVTLKPFTDNSVFSDIVPGDYKIKIKDENGCVVLEEVSVTSSFSPIDFTTEIKNATTHTGGEIIINNVTGGVSPYQYSIDNGDTFVASNIFDNLPEGNYTVVVKDAVNCLKTINVTVLMEVLDSDNDGNPDTTDPNPLVPVASDDILTIEEGTTGVVDVLANDDFLAGGSIALTQVGGTAGGTIVFEATTGTLAYTPLTGEGGTIVTVEYKVCNTSVTPNVCETATVTITVEVNTTTLPTTPTIDSQVTHDTTPVITGTADSVDVITVTVNSITYTEGDGNLVDNGDGTWSLTIPTGNEISEGTYDVVVEATNAAGNKSSDLTTNELVIDVTLPTTPTIDSQVTHDTTPVITGTADSVDIITVTVNSITYTEGDGNLVDNGDGTWSLTIPTGNEISEGTYDVTVEVTDAAGNTSSDVTTNELVIGADTDGDGIIDSLDVDDDNDGIPDVAEGAGDTDGDGVPDSKDLDSDNDGILDVEEGGNGASDTNKDGLISSKDIGFSDSDGDGQADMSVDVNEKPDTDGDGIPDFQDLDSDNDGINDVVEDGNIDVDNDGITEGGDSDNDGIMDAVDGDTQAFGEGIGGEPNNLDSDADGIPNYRDLDSDDDGVNDVVEGGNNLFDLDKNGIVDGNDTDADGILNSVDQDENNFGDAGNTNVNETDPTDPNSGGSGVVSDSGTDTDGDGIADSVDGDNTVFGDKDICADLSFETEIINSGNTAASGVITIIATGGSGNYQYSIDGNIFVDTPVFSDLVGKSYTVTVRDSKGCTQSKIVTVIEEDIDTTILVDGDKLTAALEASKYQWIDVTTQSKIEGETNKSFIVKKPGKYRVEMIVDAAKKIVTIKKAEKTYSSPTHIIEVLSVSDEHIKTLKIYPNPTKKYLSIPSELLNKKYTIYSALGKELFKGTLNSDVLLIDTISEGIYYLKVDTYKVFKFIKK